MLVALALALFAGALTTVAGMGGGQVLLLGLAAWWDPATALTATGPALLVGNGHRLWLFREGLGDVRGFVVAAFTGAIVGGLIATMVPEWTLRAMMIGMAGLAGARAFGLKLRVPAGAFIPGGFIAGIVSANGGGAGLIIGPMLLAHGTSGSRYIATMAAGGVSIHLGRTLAYGASGWVDAQTMWVGGALAVGIATGNALGARARTHIPRGWSGRLELGAVGACLALVLLNLK